MQMIFSVPGSGGRRRRALKRLSASSSSAACLGLGEGARTHRLNEARQDAGC